jgi:hypothetical protein
MGRQADGKPGVSRRDLGVRAAMAAASALAFTPTSAPAQGRGGQTPLAAADQAEVDSKFAEVVRKYGARLSDEQKTRVRNTLGNHQRMLARMRTFPLENSDAPATGLRLVPNDTESPKPTARPARKG